MGWPKTSFGFFCKMLWKNLNEPFDQPNRSEREIESLFQVQLVVSELRFYFNSCLSGTFYLPGQKVWELPTLLLKSKLINIHFVSDELLIACVRKLNILTTVCEPCHALSPVIGPLLPSCLYTRNFHGYLKSMAREYSRAGTSIWRGFYSFYAQRPPNHKISSGLDVGKHYERIEHLELSSSCHESISWCGWWSYSIQPWMWLECGSAMRATRVGMPCG